MNEMYHARMHNLLTPDTLDGSIQHQLRPCPGAIMPEGEGDAQRLVATMELTAPWRPLVVRCGREVESPAPTRFILRDEVEFAERRGATFHLHSRWPIESVEGAGWWRVSTPRCGFYRAGSGTGRERRSMASTTRVSRSGTWRCTLQLPKGCGGRPPCSLSSSRVSRKGGEQHSEEHERSTSPSYLYLVNGCRLEHGGLSVRADKTVTLYPQRMEDGQYVLENQGSLAAQIEFAGCDWESARIMQLDPLGRTCGEVCCNAGGAMVLAV